MPELILHIGRPKTGTSTFQHLLWQNKERLPELGIGYPTFNRSHNHFEIAGLERPLDNVLNLRRQIRTEDDRQQLRARVRADVERLGKLDTNVTILTSEHLSNNVSRAKIQGTYDLLAGTHDRMKVVFFIRRSDYLAPSYYGQLVEAAVPDAFDEDFVRFFWPQFDQRPLFDNWTSVFGRENVVVYPYLERFKGERDAVNTRLFEQMGIAWPPPDFDEWDGDEDRNPSLQAEQAAYLYRLNADVPRFRRDNTTNAKMRKLLLDEIKQRYGGGSITLPASVKDALDEIAPAASIVDHLDGLSTPQAAEWQEWLDQPPAPEGDQPPVSEEQLEAIKQELFAPNGPILTNGALPYDDVRPLKKWASRARNRAKRLRQTDQAQ